MVAKADWMDLVMQDPTGGQWKSLRVCDSMVVAQHALASTRLAAKAVRDSGRARKVRCLAERDSASARKCLESLSGLRGTLHRLVRTEDSIRTDVGRFASACPSAGWKRRVEYHRWERQRDSTCQIPSDTSCGRILSRIAAVSWIPDWRVAPRAGFAPRKTRPVWPGEAIAILDRAIGRPDAPGRDTLLARSAFLLSRAGFEDSSRGRFEALLSWFPSSPWTSSAHLALGRSLAVPPALRREHLRSARTDSVLEAAALGSEIDLLEADGRPAEAADSLVVLLRHHPDLADPPTLFRLATLSEKGNLEPDEIQTRLVPPVAWADALYLLQIRLELRANRFDKALIMLAAFQVRFPNSGLGPAARDLLSRARRRDPSVLGPAPK